MKRTARIVAAVAGLILLLHVAPGWGQPVCVDPGCNPTVSDSNSNTAGGTNALKNLSGGIITFPESNTGFGFWALAGTTTGDFNTAIGSGALEHNAVGNSNTACGAFALFQNKASNNVAVGTSALLSNTDGINNSALGTNALLTNVTGDSNTAVGLSALRNSTGTKNIALGFKAGINLTGGNNNIYIGNNGASTESQTIRLGTGQAHTFIAGIANANVNGPTVQVDSNTGQLGIALSSARYKQDIVAMGSQSEAVLKLRPVTFAYKEDTRGMRRYGLIAEEVAAVYPELVTHSATGEVQTVKYQELIPMLLNELQRQRQAVERQERELAELRILVGQGREMMPSAK